MFYQEPASYGPAIATLLLRSDICPLGPGTPVEASRCELESLDIATIALGKDVIDDDMAQCCLSGLWLLFNFLDESHTISQGIPTATGSYWHGVMHRREPDYSNAKYWFRRVGDHPAFESLHRRAVEMAQSVNADSDTRFLTEQASWSPFHFVDLCNVVVGSDRPSEALCRDIAHLEWQILFDFCYHCAFGES